ncbi:MAG: outer membrane beta-barrel protein [Alphaproteobacteria bacterium]|nr:outer membrane beta-barrel protein [Alphaproteobacteria bacterium]
MGIDAVGYLPCNEKIELFAIAGVGYYNFDIKLDQKINDLNVHLTKNDTAFRAGLGAQYNINEKWALRGMARYHNIDIISIISVI